MDDRYEFNKLIKSLFDYMTKKLMKGFKLMAAGGSSSFHHGETHKTIIFEDFDDWFYGFRHNKAYLNSWRNNQQSTSMEETKESPSFVGGEVEKVLHQEYRKLFPSDFEKYEQKSHDIEE